MIQFYNMSYIKVKHMTQWSTVSRLKMLINTPDTFYSTCSCGCNKCFTCYLVYFFILKSKTDRNGLLLYILLFKRVTVIPFEFYSYKHISAVTWGTLIFTLPLTEIEDLVKCYKINSAIFFFKFCKLFFFLQL